MPTKPTRTWVLIADGSRAKVVHVARAGGRFLQVDDMTLSIDLPKSGDLLADRPGRTFDSVGAGRHAKENTADPHRELKRTFAGTVVHQLRRAMLARRFDRLILVAPPSFLGDLREELPKDLRNKVAGEVNSDLTNMPEQELHAHLADVLASPRS